MIEDPGSFAGRIISPIPDLGPQPKYRISFAILKNEVATTLKARESSTMQFWATSASSLLMAVLNVYW